MGNTADIIQALIMRIEQYRKKKQNKKIVNQLIIQLENRFHDFLVEEDDAVFFRYATKLFCSSSVNPYITDNFFPTNIDEYANYGNILGFSNDFRFEIRWLITCLAFAQDEINDFVAQREMYDNHVLLNEYEEALAIVEDIERKYGVSYWTRILELAKQIYGEILGITPNMLYDAYLEKFKLDNSEVFAKMKKIVMKMKEKTLKMNIFVDTMINQLAME